MEMEPLDSANIPTDPPGGAHLPLPFGLTTPHDQSPLLNIDQPHEAFQHPKHTPSPCMIDHLPRESKEKMRASSETEEYTGDSVHAIQTDTVSQHQTGIVHLRGEGPSKDCDEQIATSGGFAEDAATVDERARVSHVLVDEHIQDNPLNIDA
jgi:hypothetical protein